MQQRKLGKGTTGLNCSGDALARSRKPMIFAWEAEILLQLMTQNQKLDRRTELSTPCHLGAGDGKQAGEKFCRRALLDKNRSETPKKINWYTLALGGTEWEQESRRRSELENTANRTTQWELTTGTSAA
jgi:hypothetical protein